MVNVALLLLVNVCAAFQGSHCEASVARMLDDETRDLATCAPPCEARGARVQEYVTRGEFVMREDSEETIAEDSKTTPRHHH